MLRYMEIDDSLLTLFHAEIASSEGQYTLTVPDREVDLGDISEGGTYRIAVLPTTEEVDPEENDIQPRQPTEDEMNESEVGTPPVTEGERVTAQIDTIGDEGDGVAFVEGGYAVFISGAQVGETILAEITDVRDRYAFADPVNGRSKESVKT